MTHFLHLVWVYDAYKCSIDWTLCVKLGKLQEICARYFPFSLQTWKKFPKYKFREKHCKRGCLNHLHRFTPLEVYADIRTKTLTHYLECAYQCNNSPLEQQGVITCSKQVGQDCCKLLI